MSQLVIAEGAAPATPSAGLVTAYMKPDHAAYMKDSTGLETTFMRSSLAAVVGGIIFGVAGGLVSQDATTLFWDNTNKRLGIGNATPAVALDVTGAIKTAGYISGGNSPVNPGGLGANRWVIDNLAGQTRFFTYGPDTTTNGTFKINSQRSNGSNAFDVITTNTVGDVAFPSGLIGTDVGDFAFKAGGASMWKIASTGGHLTPINAGQNIGSSANPIASIIVATSIGIGLTPGRTFDVLGPSNAVTARIVRNDAGVAGNLILDLQNGSGGGTTVASIDSVGTGRFGTSLVVPQLTSAGNLLIQTPGGGNLEFSSGTGVVRTNSDFTHIFGDPTHRWITGYFSSIDSGTTASLLLATNNGKTQAKIVNAGDGTNFANIQGGGSPFSPVIFSNGGDTNIGLIFGSKGSGSIDFTTGGTFSGDINSGRLTQAQVLNTVGATRAATITGSNGGNVQWGSTAGGSDFTSATIRFTGIGTTAVAANATLNAVGSNDLLRSTSSKRYKTEIEALSRDEALTLLRKLNPITYASLSEHDDPYLRHSGFIAEEVFDINPLFVSLSNKRPESVQYERLTVPLVAGWQDHDARLAALEARIS